MEIYREMNKFFSRSRAADHTVTAQFAQELDRVAREPPI